MLTEQHTQHEDMALNANLKTTGDVPVGGKINSIKLHFKTGAGADATVAQIKAEISNIKLAIDGREIVNTTPTKLFDLYGFLANNVTKPSGEDGVLELNIGALAFVDVDLRNIFGLGTSGVNVIQVTVDSGALVNIASAQIFTSRTPVNEALGQHIKFIDYPQSFNAVGSHDVTNLPKDDTISYLAVFTDDGTAGSISHGECKLGEALIYDTIPTAINASRLSDMNFEQPSGYFVYNFMNGTGQGKIDMSFISKTRFRTTFDVACGASGYTHSLLSVQLPEKKLGQ